MALCANRKRLGAILRAGPTGGDEFIALGLADCDQHMVARHRRLVGIRRKLDPWRQPIERRRWIVPLQALSAQPDRAVVVGQIVSYARKRVKLMFMEREGLAIGEAILGKSERRSFV
ncbi:hypothetical protein QCM77_28100 [Bradyrhizobium sp. SSUT18]|uniref:hypothetical protein n=1 Tax=Bradyrhizobium sp. SSUT18 TaxID=3040602 RepID=UPI00244B699C|nr:hypothetical protein [Bradyrhizobium sp. SSUT18]MDH2403788.1 hypothetical protein [Bradyrhizobium sp. SSUT18]